MNPIQKFKNMTPEEKNRSYTNTIIICVFIVVLLIFAILAISFPEADGSEKVPDTDAWSAASEMRAGLLIRSEDSLSSALSYVETNYANTPADKRSEMADKRFTKDFYSFLKERAGIRKNATEETVQAGRGELKRVAVPEGFSVKTVDNDYDDFMEYLESLIGDKWKAKVSASGKHMYLAYSKAGNYVEIQNIKIKCSDGSEAVTSLRFTPPDDAAGDSSAAYIGSVNDYAAVADGDIKSTGGSNRLRGSVYAGKAIEADGGGRLETDGAMTVTRGDIKASGSAMISILQGELWTRNIRTLKSDNSIVSVAQDTDNIRVNGDCYVLGDLDMANSGYGVDIYGNYYGYGSADDEEETNDAEERSSSSADSSSGDSSQSASQNAGVDNGTDTALRRLLSGRYTMLTNSDGTTGSTSTTASQPSQNVMLVDSSGSNIRISGTASSANIAYGEGQKLWLNATGYYDAASQDGRPAITEVTVPADVDRTMDESEAENLNMLYKNEYYGLISGLDKNSASKAPKYKLAQHILENSGITDRNVIYTQDEDGRYQPHKLSTSRMSSGEYISVTPRSEYRSGVIIADCDVRIVNVNFSGTIITTGDIILCGGAYITADNSDARFTSIADSRQEAENTRVQVQFIR